MTRYEIKLTDQEVLNLKQMMNHPGFPAMLKLLDGLSLDAQADAMECKDRNHEARSLALTEAQATAGAVSKVKKLLGSYIQVEEQPVAETFDPLDFKLYN